MTRWELNISPVGKPGARTGEARRDQADFECRWCGRGFRSAGGLSAHLSECAAPRPAPAEIEVPRERVPSEFEERRKSLWQRLYDCANRTQGTRISPEEIADILALPGAREEVFRQLCREAGLPEDLPPPASLAVFPRWCDYRRHLERTHGKEKAPRGAAGGGENVEEVPQVENP